MNGSKGMLNSLKGTSTLVRARFGPGMLLQHDDLEQLNTYTRELSRLLFRSFFGCGVVCGLKVKYERVCGKPGITVDKGLALDCSGDPVYVPKAQKIELAGECQDEIPYPLWVLLCPTTKCCAPRASVCASDDDEPSSSCTRERDGFEIRIVSGYEPPKCSCGCFKDRKPFPEYVHDYCGCVNPDDPCYKAHYAGECGCETGDDCECGCECIVLARLTGSSTATGEDVKVDHSVRRLIRPVLMRDAVVEKERYEKTKTVTVGEASQPVQTPELAKATEPAATELTKATEPGINQPAATTEATANGKPPRKITKSMKLPETSETPK